jgi:hypothetical protein
LRRSSGKVTAFKAMSFAASSAIWAQSPVAEHEALRIRLDDLDRVHVRVELGADPGQQEQRALEVDPVPRDVERLRQLLQADVHAAQAHQVLEAALGGRA